jgi:tetratricopeptide (TPR) repeat protein
MFINPNSRGSASRSRYFYSSILSLLVIFIPILTTAAGPDSQQQPRKNSFDPAMVTRVMEMLNRSNHDSVLVLCKAMIATDPESPIGYFLASHAYQTIMRDFRIKTYQAQFDSLIVIAASKASSHLERDSTAESHFVCGAVQGYYCLALFHAGSYVRAIKTAGSSVSLLRKAAQMDPDFIDPLFGIAIYEYTRSKLLFGFLGGKKEEAIANLRQVEKAGRYMAANASYSLQAIYFENGQYDSALVVNDRLFKRYPASPSALYNRALLLEKTKRPEEAQQLWNTLVTVLQLRKPASNGFLAESYYHLASLQHQAKNDAQAQKLLIQSAQCASRRRGEEELEGKYVKFNEIKNMINEALRTWGQRGSTPPQAATAN